MANEMSLSGGQGALSSSSANIRSHSTWRMYTFSRLRASSSMALLLPPPVKLLPSKSSAAFEGSHFSITGFS